jgi:hypothetical protein
MAWPRSWVKPSRVRAYIESAVGREPPKPPNDLNAWRAEHLGNASALVDSVDGIDQRILAESLTAEQGFEWIQAVSFLRSAVLAWQGGQQNQALARAGGLSAHPVLVIYRLLDHCPDEITPKAEPRLTFIADAKLRTSIARDVDALDALVRDEEWKAATVIGGSVVEALLLDRLLDAAFLPKAKAAEATRIAKKELGWHYAKPLERWDLWQFIIVANEVGLINDTIAHVCDGARDFRNLIHASKERAETPCDRGTALAALAAVENLIATFDGSR